MSMQLPLTVSFILMGSICSCTFDIDEDLRSICEWSRSQCSEKKLAITRDLKTVFFYKSSNRFLETGYLLVIGLSLTPSPLTLESRPSTGLPSRPTSLMV